MRDHANILVADDDRDDQLLFREALERSCGGRCSVQAVYNGVELLQRLHERDVQMPDLIVLDLNMPLKDGVATLREIRSEKRYNQLPVFILSTSSRPDDITECRQLGCSNYYVKPYRLTEYNNIISDMMLRTFHEV